MIDKKKARHIGRIVEVAGVALVGILGAIGRRFPQGTEGGVPKGKRAMPQLFSPGANRIFRGTIIGGIILLAVILVVIDQAPRSSLFTGVERFTRQDIPFSHEHHAGEIGIDCRFCHQSVEKSSFAGIPQTQTCMKCHRVLFKDAPMLAPVRESFATGKPLSWNRVYKLPDFVYFDHSIHIAKGVSCQTCHGDLARMPWVRKVDAFFMSRCLGCHRDAGMYVKPAGATLAKRLTECSICHR
jgi:hypothetical protein